MAEIKICPMRSGAVCAEKLCMWWTEWNDKGMCCMNRIVQFIDKKDVSNAEKERLRNMMKEELI